jgi:hypothetical protein
LRNEALRNAALRNAALRNAALRDTELNIEVGTGSLTFVQYFGSSLNLHPHLHMIFLDGGYVSSGPARFEFKRSVGFNTAQMFDILQDISDITAKLLRKFGYITTEGEVIEVGDRSLAYQSVSLAITGSF